MDLKKINAVGCWDGFLPAKPLSELTLKHKYSVIKILKVQTKFGIRIVVELDAKCIIFLPARFLRILDEDPTKLEKMQEAATSKKLQIMYHGGPYNNIKFISVD